MKRILIILSVLTASFYFSACGTQKSEIKPSSGDEMAQKRIAELENYTKKLESDLSNKQAELDNMTKSGADSALLTKLSNENADLEYQINKLKTADMAEKDLIIKRALRVDAVYNDLRDKMKSEIDSGDIVLGIVNNAITVNIKEKIFFNSGEADITAEGKAFLHKVAPVFKQLTGKVIRIEGHTDNVPIAPDHRDKYPSNWELGAVRAINVVRYLQESEVPYPVIYTK